MKIRSQAMTKYDEILSTLLKVQFFYFTFIKYSKRESSSIIHRDFNTQRR